VLQKPIERQMLRRIFVPNAGIATAARGESAQAEART
jgi:hypothetical protein